MPDVRDVMEINDIWYLPNRIKVSIVAALCKTLLRTVDKTTFLPGHDKIVQASLSLVLQVAAKK